jgi:hypothetical protein
MNADRPTSATSSRQDPFRWPRTFIVDTLDKFADSDASSQRQFAEQLYGLLSQ